MHRRYREGSYAKPPRPEDKPRRYEERERSRRYNTVERERRYEDEREKSRRRDRDRYGVYREIDPTRLYHNVRREEEERRRGELLTSSLLIRYAERKHLSLSKCIEMRNYLFAK